MGVIFPLTPDEGECEEKIDTQTAISVGAATVTCTLYTVVTTVQVGQRQGC